MSRRREHHSGVRPHRTGGPGTRPSPDGEPDLLDHVRELLRAGDQVGVLMLASTIVSELEQGPTLPFQGAQADDGLSLADLVDSFINVRAHEMTAMLAALAALVTDDVLRQHIRRELDRRGGPLPAGLDPLEPLSVDRTVVATHVLTGNIFTACRSGSHCREPSPDDPIERPTSPRDSTAQFTGATRHALCGPSPQGPLSRIRDNGPLGSPCKRTCRIAMHRLMAITPEEAVPGSIFARPRRILHQLRSSGDPRGPLLYAE